MWRLAGVLAILFLSIPLPSHAAPPDSTAVPPPELRIDRAELRMEMIHPNLTMTPGSFAPARLVSLPDLATSPAWSMGMRDGSPLDTLHMSLLEKGFWGRHGLFRSLGIFKTDREKPVNDLRRIVKIRRKMLSLHQTLGLVTVASMATTVVAGQLAFNGGEGDFHTSFVSLTVGLYTATAALAFASPPKLIRGGGGLDTITFHKIFAALHIAGMILTPMFAPDDDEGGGSRSRLRTHQVLGYATFAAFSAGMIVVTFFK
ncbi:hypothetical protein [Rhodocaloribacter sp.]